MSLVSMTEMLQKAKEGKYAVDSSIQITGIYPSYPASR